MKNYFAECDIQIETSAPYTPQQNGKAERQNRMIVEFARKSLITAGLPLYLWAEAINTAVYTKNRIAISKTMKVTPYEAWTGRKPELSHMKIFGAQDFAHVPKQFTRKFDPKAKKMFLLGYQGDSCNYRQTDIEEQIAEQEPKISNEGHENNEGHEEPRQEGRNFRDRSEIKTLIRYNVNYTELDEPKSSDEAISGTVAIK